ncbi:MAG: CYTH domain-containing protein [Succinivibrio sp.]|nr:CYTH domain-containing protein [Succinivibrio sp.]
MSAESSQEADRQERLPLEEEIKFGVVGPLDDLPERFKALGAVSNEHSRRLENIYFDTADNALFERGIGLRLRRNGTQCEMTLKLKGENIGGLHSRGELNVPVDNELQVPDLSRFPAGVLPEGLELAQIQQKLRPICHIDFERRSFDFRALNCQFEVDYDQGGILLGEGLSHPINELEVELKDSAGSLEDTMRVFTALITGFAEQDMPLVLEPFSKMHRAAVLLGGERNYLDLRPLEAAGDLGAYIRSLLLAFENLYGLFLIKHDPLVFGCVIAALKMLIKSLKMLRRSGRAAFTSESRDPLPYRDDLKVIISILKSFALRLDRLQKAVCDCALSANAEAMDALMSNLRRMERHYRIFVIPLKLRMLLSLLVS